MLSFRISILLVSGWSSMSAFVPYRYDRITSNPVRRDTIRTTRISSLPDSSSSISLSLINDCKTQECKQEVDVNAHLSWKNYKHHQSTSPLRQKFEKSGGVTYKTSVLSNDEYATIKNEVTRARLSDETSSSVARNRVGAVLSPRSETVQILKEGSIFRLVEKICGEHYILSLDIPVEVRAYEKVGAGMEWHIDDVLYDPPQIEVVFTLENNSDCVTMWKEGKGPFLQKQRVETDDNSLILLRAGGVEHCVSSLKYGRRVILKCVFVKVGSTFHESEQVVQFSSNPNRKPNKKRRGKKK